MSIATIAENIAGMTRAQREAALTTEKPVMLIACAGSGKTKTIISRMLHLMTPKSEGGLGADGSDIMMVTFTNKAAREMRERIEPYMAELREKNPNMRGGPWIGTFHNICLRILRMESARAGLGEGGKFSIYSESESRQVIKEVVASLQIPEFDIVKFQQDVEKAKALAFTPELLAAKQLDIFMLEEQGMPLTPELEKWKVTLEQGFATEDFVKPYAAYQRILASNNAVDFSDLISKVTILFREHEDIRNQYRSYFRHLMVDEAQDTNRAQLRFLDALFGRGEEFIIPEGVEGSSDAEAGDGLRTINTYRVKNQPKPTILIVGDDDQSIYGFRGAERDALKIIERHFSGTQVLFLDESFRCQPAILSVADHIVRNAPGRYDKTIKPALPDRKSRPVIWQKHVTPDQEIEAIAAAASRHLAAGKEPGEFAVLVRTKKQVKAVARYLRAAGLPVIEGKAANIGDSEEVRDAMAFCGFMSNKSGDQFLRRIINKPARKIGAGAVGKMLKNVNIKNGPYGTISLFDEIRDIANKKIDIPEDGEKYGKAMINALTSFHYLVEQMDADVASSANAGEAVLRILERTGYLKDLRESALMAQGKKDAPYKDFPPRAFLKAYLEDCLSSRALREELEEMDSEELADAGESLNEFARRIGNLSIIIEQASRHQTLDDFVQEATLEMDTEAAKSGVRVMTVHASKGLEFESVRLPFWIEGSFPSSRALEGSAKDVQEEERLAYVAITRAIESVTISSSWKTYGCAYIHTDTTDPSRFVVKACGARMSGGISMQKVEVTGAKHSAYKMVPFELPEPEISKAPLSPDDLPRSGSESIAAPVEMPEMDDRPFAPISEDEMAQMMDMQEQEPERFSSDEEAYQPELW